MKTYQDPDTKEIRTVADDADVQIAALEKLGYVVLTADDVKNAPTLGVVYETVQDPHVPPAPPALPKLATPPPPPAKTGGVITREDVGDTDKK